MRKVAEPLKKEPPSLFCATCRRWIESREKPNAFAAVDGARKRVAVWRCPECRGEGPATVARQITAADVSKDERLGPVRRVVSDIGMNPSGKSKRVSLECGHTATVAPLMRETRCRHCRAAKAAEEESSDFEG